jgi:hypothetical protein
VRIHLPLPRFKGAVTEDVASQFVWEDLDNAAAMGTRKEKELALAHKKEINF